MWTFCSCVHVSLNSQFAVRKFRNRKKQFSFVTGRNRTGPCIGHANRAPNCAARAARTGDGQARDGTVRGRLWGLGQATKPPVEKTRSLLRWGHSNAGDGAILSGNCIPHLSTAQQRSRNVHTPFERHCFSMQTARWCSRKKFHLTTRFVQKDTVCRLQDQ